MQMACNNAALFCFSPPCSLLQHFTKTASNLIKDVSASIHLSFVEDGVCDISIHEKSHQLHSICFTGFARAIYAQGLETSCREASWQLVGKHHAVCGSDVTLMHTDWQRMSLCSGHHSEAIPVQQCWSMAKATDKLDTACAYTAVWHTRNLTNLSYVVRKTCRKLTWGLLS